MNDVPVRCYRDAEKQEQRRVSLAALEMGFRSTLSGSRGGRNYQTHPSASTKIKQETHRKTDRCCIFFRTQQARAQRTHIPQSIHTQSFFGESAVSIERFSARAVRTHRAAE